MVFNSQRTIYGIQLQTAMLVGAKYKITSNTTLNGKLFVNENYSLTNLINNGYPTLKYLAIGNGGINLINETKGLGISDHSIMDAALFNQIPFVIRKTSSDLTTTEKEKYRLRKIVYIDGDEYAYYYLRKIENINYRDNFFKVVKKNNENILSQLDVEKANVLNVTPISKSSVLNPKNNLTFVAAICKIPFTFTTDEIMELKNVFDFLKIPNYLVTELGLCTGYDITSSNNLKEAVGVQIAFHCRIGFALADVIQSGKPFTKYLDIGGGEAYINRNM